MRRTSCTTVLASRKRRVSQYRSCWKQGSATYSSQSLSVHRKSRLQNCSPSGQFWVVHKRLVQYAQIFLLGMLLATVLPVDASGSDEELLQQHCAKCHGGKKPKGDFPLSQLGNLATEQNVDLWEQSLEYVQDQEMPPADESRLSESERNQLIAFLSHKVHAFHRSARQSTRSKPRRLNNRELLNSLRDVLMIEDVGTHQPTANLLGDSLQDGFDTNGDALGISQFHLEQYIDAFRRVIDATIVTGPRPEQKRTVVNSEDIRLTSLNQRRRRERANRTRESIDILDIRLRAYFANFETVPKTGRYRIKIRAMGKDRGIYAAEQTGIHDGDPIRLRVHLGDRVRDFELPDEEVLEIELDEWLAAGTKLLLSYPTDGLRLRGNGNFKFQYAIAHDYLKEHDPARYERVLRTKVPKAPARTRKSPRHWSHWTDEWQGPRPRLFSAEVLGPSFDSWPPKRQQALLGEQPSVERAAEILRPIAERAWRRSVLDGELAPIVHLVKDKAKTLGNVEALKEGIVAVLVSPSFLLLHSEESDPTERFATKLGSTLR